MRIFALLLLAIPTGAAVQNLARFITPGVAFTLTPDYGIAAMHLEDGSSVRVAQIHGSPAYQDFMRKNYTSSSTEPGAFCRLFSQTLDRLPSAITTHIDICRNADVTHTKALMAALKAATELYLGSNICYATLSLEDVSEHKVDVANEALSALGLHPVLAHPIQASKSFVYALQPKSAPEFDEEPWLVLAIDYSAHWFSVGLYTIGEFAIVDPVEGYVGGPRIDEDNQLDALRETLSHLFTHPPADIRLPEDLRHLMIYGDDAHNEDFHRMLEDVLLNVQSPTQQTRDLLRNANVSSSVFDGPAYTAHVAKVHMTTIDFLDRRPSAFGCKWRSGLYYRERLEL